MIRALLLAALLAAPQDEARPVAAGLDALATLAAGRGDSPAARRLGYVDGRPAPDAALRAAGLAPSEWGWLPAEQLAARRAFCVPEGGLWMDPVSADAARSRWTSARRLRFTFAELRSDLPLAEAAAAGRALDRFLEWLRAAACLQPGWREPAWPLEFRVCWRRQDFRAEAGRDDPLAGLCLYPSGTGVIVDASAAKELPGGLDAVLRHEGAHALLRLAFHREGAPRPASGWTTEAFAEWCGLAAPETGAAADVAGILAKRATRARELERLRDGEDAIGLLEGLDYDAAVRHPQAYVAGPLWVARLMADAARRESLVAFLAEVHAGAGDFAKRFGPAGECSRLLLRP